MRRLYPLCALALLSACSPHSAQPDTNNSAALKPVQMNEARFRNDIKALSSDEFEGRAPTTHGEKLTLDYLTKAFTEMGLKGAYQGSFLQPVPMVSYTADEAQQVTLAGLPFKYRQDIVLNSRHDNGGIRVENAPLVFVGYGVNAPEYGWNDYQDLNMKGKIAVILVNDPGFARPDSGKFTGKAMTYYGRWSYKFEEASRQGALGALIIHDTEPASYPWSVIENSWTGPQQDLVLSKAEQDSRVQVEGWLTLDAATQIFDKAGLSLPNLMARAADSPINLPLEQTANIAFKNKAEYANSYNVVATLPGNTQADEQILFTAHWDHIGKDETKTGDQIYNGAMDNASGIAGILEIARQLVDNVKQGHGLARSVTFIATTGEEQGLLGSRYYAANPLYPIDKTVAVLNLDSTNIYGKTKDFTIVGKGKSELETYLIDAAKQQNRIPMGEKNPASGGFFRSDHFSFAKLGVPAVFAGGGSDPIDEATAAYKTQMQATMKGCYHNVCDEYREDWDLSGALQDLQIYYQVTRTLGNSKDWPGYYQGTEFNSLRPAKTTLVTDAK
ncbi:MULTISPECIES: M28 family metallopeptidase [Shewanella]|jgi:Zn-dependent M28 family amino/carboxypeptidase|uniref:M28 family peptidase n=1 Tax=Shewanella putrefaciens TaxID=24 RepID=A0ABX8XFA7_SHEPU|nr:MULTISPECIES: M28 family metallopeptidase [Shewanella]AVV82760.1 peptidase M28 [Shewanella putrefaciens]MCK7633762.1 M28 family metallopeptidase [Shewanella sp. JNE17]MCK7648855.1 M28 family metallopeptidase [Shewanella sp. JNE8]MCK7657068.1 M28 family metallopeptidase [Shewanella sp. JNE4-2]MCT8942094.1 M28 family metallopeptidase [Shewanella putrefaciens]